MLHMLNRSCYPKIKVKLFSRDKFLAQEYHRINENYIIKFVALNNIIKYSILKLIMSILDK